MICPNYKLKAVFDGFNEMVIAFGGKPMTEEEFRDPALRKQRKGSDYSAMEAAYKVYNRNGGNFLDQTPDGKESILFKTLLNHFGNDRNLALNAKANVYSDEFAKWFGDWWGPLNVQDEDIKYGPISKVVDENGEPLIVYHGGSSTNIFDTSGKRSGGAGIKKGIKGSYFTTSKKDAKRYEEIYTFKTGEKWIAIADEIIDGVLSKEEIADIDKKWEIEKPSTRAFFLNIKTPIETIYTGNDKDGYTESTITPENYDGQHITIEGKSYEEYVATNPNQIKSATDNNGDFSTIDDNIYHLTNNSIYQKILYSQSAVDLTDLLEKGVFNTLRKDGVINSSDVLSKMLYANKITSDNIELARILSKHNIPIKLDSSLGIGELAVTDTSNGKSIILINSAIIPKVTNQYFNDILLHEIIHAVTVDVINNPQSKEEIRFVEANEKAFRRAKAMFGKEGDPFFNDAQNYGYAFENEKEFAAFFASDPYFRNQVYAMAQNHQNKRTIFKAIKDFINSITDVFVNRKFFTDDITKLDNYKNTFKQFLLNQQSISSDRKLSNKELIELYKSQNGSLYDYEAFIEQCKDLDRQAKQERNFLKWRGKVTRKADNIEIASFDEIAQKLQTRIEGIRVSAFDQVTKNNLIQSAQTQRELFLGETSQKYIAITNILKNAIPTLLDDVEKIRAARSGRTEISNDELMYHIHSNIGTYHSIFNTLDKLLNESKNIDDIVEQFNKNNQDKISADDLYRIQKDVQNAIGLTQSALNTCEKLLMQNGCSILYGVADSVGATPFMDEYVNALGANKAFYLDDVSEFELTLGAADSSKSEAIRAVSHMIQTAVYNAHIKTIPVATRLLELKDALKRGEHVTDLYERDEKGNFTARLVRDLNFGRFYADYDKFIITLNDSINKKYNLNLASDNRCAPDGDGQEKARDEWERLKNQWLSEHCERKYIPEYYEIYNKIPQFARNAQHDITTQIQAIQDKYLDKGLLDSKGHYHYDVLSEEDWRTLQLLWEKRRVLKSDYNEFGLLREINSPDWEVAKALQKFDEDINNLRKKLGGSSEMSLDKKAWEDDRNEVIKKCGGKDAYNKWLRGEKDHGFDEKTLRNWDERNSRVTFKKNEFDEIKVFQDIYDSLEGNTIDYGQEYEDLSEQIRGIKKSYRLPNGDLDGRSMPIATRNLLLDLYKQRAAKKKQFLIEHPELMPKYQQYVREFQARLRFVDTEEFKKIKEEIHKQAISYYQSQGEEDSLYEDDYEYILLGEYGTFVQYDDSLFDEPDFIPYPWLQRMEAVNFEEYMQFEPGYGYLDKEENNNIFLNKKFKDEYETTYVPKRELYDNSEAFNKIKNSDTLRALYEEAISVIKKSNEMQTNRQFHDNYQLPSITASLLSRMSRKSTWLHFGRFLKNVLGRLFGVIQDPTNTEYGAENEEHSYKDELQVPKTPNKIKNRYPDGRQFHMVPQFYTKRMENPFEISTNLVDILSSYYNMSCQYYEKTKIKDDVEIIVDMIKNQKFNPTKWRNIKDLIKAKDSNKTARETIGGQNEDESTTYKVLRDVVERDLYNVRRKKVSGGTEELISNWHRWTTARNLGLNPVVAAAGFFTTMWTHTINACTGYRYGKLDAFKAGGIVLGHIAKNFAGAKYIGNRLSKDKLMLLMEGMNLSNQFERKTNNAQRNRFVQAVIKNSTYGFLSAVDFTTKSQIAVSTFLAYRYIDGKFVTKRDILNMRTEKNAKDIDKMLEDYKKARTLYSVLKSNGTSLDCEEKYKKAWEEVRFRAFKSAEKYAEQADGMTTSYQKALVHRQYITVVLQEIAGNRVYDYDTQELKNNQFANVFKFAHNMAMSSSLGSMGTGAFVGLAFGGFGLFPIVAGASVGIIWRLINKSTGRNKSVEQVKKEMFGDYSSRKSAMVSVQTQYSLKQTFLEVMLYNSLIVPIANLMCAFADDDKDNLLLQTLAFWARRVQWETKAKYNAVDMVNNIRSLTAATSVSDGLQQVYDDFTFARGHKGQSIVKTIYDVASGNDDEFVKSGVYKDETKFERSLQKLTPWHNIKEQVGGYGFNKEGELVWKKGSPDKKRSYNENKIMKLTKEEKESWYYILFDKMF